MYIKTTLDYLTKRVKKQKTNLHLWCVKGREGRLSIHFSFVQHIILDFNLKRPLNLLLPDYKQCIYGSVLF